MNKEKLHTIFSHSDCLSENKLLAYSQNQLSNIERNEVEQHTINCKFCSDAIEGFEKFPNSINSFNSTKALLNKKSTSKRSLIITITGIAASIVVAIMLFNNDPKPKSAEVIPVVTDKADSLPKRRSAPIANYEAVEESPVDSSEVLSFAVDSVTERHNQLDKSYKKEEKKKAFKINSNEDIEEVTKEEYFEEPFEEDLEEEELPAEKELKIVESQKPQKALAEAEKLISFNDGRLKDRKQNEAKEKAKEVSLDKESDLATTNSPNEAESKKSAIEELTVTNSKVKEAVAKNEENKSSKLIASERDELAKNDIDTNSISRISIDLGNKTSISSAENVESYDSVTVILDDLDEDNLSIESTSDDQSVENEVLDNSDSFDLAETTEENDSKKQALLDSTTVDLAFNEGITLFNNKSYKVAITKLSEIKKDNPNFFKAQLHIGKSYVLLKDNIKAKPYLEKALNGENKVKTEAQLILDSIK